ncbi:tetratricopeptide repeat protein [Streptomyces prasinus]|uniref:tetratricopeptide repeat protein n=1 Tax=Streptomyces prasinus TaxID=67345 RepID=UPI000A723873|nr:tetratricopeptide repeat protein [Streptomyces prasinus]
MDSARVAVVRSGDARGSGYVLGGRLVLTAAHVLKDHGRVSVQLQNRAGQVPCQVVWERFEGGPEGWDAALLLAGEDLSDRPLPGIRWGRLVTMQACPAQSMGYPVGGQPDGGAVSLVQVDGRVLPESGRDRDRYVLVGEAGAESHKGASPWGGMSGAALWCGSGPGMVPLLTGVVVGDPPGWSHTRLEAMPAYVLASDPVVRELVEEHTGRAMLLEPADLQHLTDRTAIPRPPRSPADLLRPEQAAVSFMGREDLLKDLTYWCQPPSDQAQPTPHGGPTGVWAWEQSLVQVRLLTGPGGAGKTRLAAELAARMTGRGWAAIRLTTDAKVPLDLLSQVRRPLLVIVDYAETRTPQLHALLEAVDHDQVIKPVRVLALARAAGDWWTRAIEHPHSQALATAPVTPVPALHHTPQDRATAYRQALSDFSTRLRRLFPATDWAALLPALTAADAVPALAGTEFDTPLSVQMAALLALLDATGASQPPGRATALEGRLLGHERKYWDETANNPERGLTGERSGAETRALAVALACLVPAADRDHARVLLAQLPGLADDSAAAVCGALATWLADLYPTPAGSVWGSLQPDRIAEYHLGTQLSREPALFTRILTALPGTSAEQALTVLARTTQHPHHHDVISSILCDAVTTAPTVLGPAALATATRTPHPAPLIAALTRLIRATRDITLLHRLSNQLPDSTLALSEWAAILSTALVGHHDTHDPDLSVLAGSLNNQSNRLAGLGRREEALTAITRAVKIREVLAKQHPDALPDLAMSLNNQSTRLADLGRREEALTAITRAVETYQTLAKQHPDAFLPDLAGSLNNQSVYLADLGRREEALTAITRAVETYQTLAKQRPDAFLPDLAMSLNNQSTRLADLGRREEALTTITRAVETYQTLAKQHPDAFLPDLAASLNNQSNHLADLGRREEALTAITRAVETYQTLAKQHPDAFLPDLAASLNNQSARLADLGRREEALTAITRAVEIREALAEQHPDVFLPDLAVALNNQSNHLAGLGRREEALTAITRAVETYQTLAKQRPDVFLPDLAMSLDNQSARLAGLGRWEEALTVITRAVEIREALAKQRPDVFLPDLAGSLNNQSVRLGDVGRWEEALTVITRAVETYQTLAKQRPDVFLPDLAGSLNNQSARLADLGRWEEALTTITRAVEIREALAEQHPDVFLPDLAASLNNQSNHLAGLGRWEEALTTITRAVETYQTLAKQHPDAFLPDLAVTLNNQCNRLAGLGRWEEALAAITRAVETYQTLAKQHPEVFAEGLKRCLRLREFLKEALGD